MIWETIRGHGNQVEMFRRCLRRGRLSHAYLFAGPEGIGKKTFARALAQCLFCQGFSEVDLQACGRCPACRQMKAGSHPDFLIAGVPEGKSELPIDLIAGPPERRGREGLCYEMSLSPMSATRKIAVIDDAHLMSEESANALLKTLEEPPPDSVLVLISSNADDLLPTIRSRCQQVRFAPLAPRDLAQLLVELELVDGTDEAAAVATVSDGSLAIAGQLLDPSLRGLRQKLYDCLASDDPDTLKTAEQMVAGIEEIGGDSKNQRRTAGWVVRFVIGFFSGALRRLAGDTTGPAIEQVCRFAGHFAPAQPDDLDLVTELIERALLAEAQLERYTPVPLCLEGLFDDLGRMIRRRMTV